MGTWGERKCPVYNPCFFANKCKTYWECKIKNNNNKNGFIKDQYLIDEMKVGDTWRIFKILSEFVDGFENLSKIEPAISVFGSARIKEGRVDYRKARTMGRLLEENGITVLTGVSPLGIIKAANPTFILKMSLHLTTFLPGN